MRNLEYSQEQGQWHYSIGIMISILSSEWNIIARDQPVMKLNAFTDFMKKKYPYGFNTTDPSENISTETVKEEYEVFDEWYEYFKSIGHIKL